MEVHSALVTYMVIKYEGIFHYVFQYLKILLLLLEFKETDSLLTNSKRSIQ